MRRQKGHGGKKGLRRIPARAILMAMDSQFYEKDTGSRNTGGEESNPLPYEQKGQLAKKENAATEM